MEAIQRAAFGAANMVTTELDRFYEKHDLREFHRDMFKKSHYYHAKEENFNMVQHTVDYPLARVDHAMLIMLGYILFVMASPVIMAVLPPINLKPLKMVYNPVQVVVCAYIVYFCVTQAYTNGYGFVCNDFDNRDPKMVDVMWYFFLTKILDFCDTVFIVLAKKKEQLSFLHVYHHIGTYLIFWFLLNVGYDGDSYLIVALNSAVHVVMYFYYFLTLLDIRPWWKKYVTKMQMVQFMIANFHGGLLIWWGCSNVYVNSMYIVFLQTLFWLFYMFDKKAYNKKNSAKKSQ